VPRATAWIFQARPGDWELEKHLAAVARIEWLVNRHLKRMQIGDTVFMWESGEAGVLRCRCVMRSKPAERRLRADNRPFCASAKYLADDVVRAGLEVMHVFDPPLSRDAIVAIPALSEAAPFGGATMARMGTNFELSTPEAKALLALARERGDAAAPREP
jgi:hypothetical protein